MMFSIFPFIILLLSMVRFLPFEQEQILSFTAGIMPDEVDNFFSGIVIELRNNTNNTITFVSAAVLLWSASKGVYSVIGGLNSVFEQREGRHFIRVRLLSILYTLAFVIIITVTLTLLVFGNRIISLTERNFSSYYALIFIVMSLRYLIGFCFLVLFFNIIYKALPSGKHRFFTQLPGAVVAAVGWIAFSVFFSFYIDNFSNYTTLYGSLTAVVLLMLWLYFCMYILFFGAEINLYYKKRILGE
jgi:membrane protein